MKEGLTNFKTSKGAIQFTVDNPLPEKIIIELLNIRLNDIKKNEELIEQVPPSSKILSQVAKPIKIKEIKDPETQNIINTMLRIAYGRQGDKNYPTLVGLAAPQIGISKRIIIIGINSVGDGQQPELRAFINPKILKLSKETEDGREGCFSTSRVCGIVERSKSIVFEAYDRNVKKVTITLEGFPARIAQHEIDHLNGIRFPDRITDNSKLHWVEEYEFGKYRNNWKKWTIKCSPEKWQAIKSGLINFVI